MSTPHRPGPAVGQKVHTPVGRFKIITSALVDDGRWGRHTVAVRVINKEGDEIGVLLSVPPAPAADPHLVAALTGFHAPARGLVGRALARLDPLEQSRYSEEWAADAGDISGVWH